MAPNDLVTLSISELAPKIASREVSPVEVTAAAIAQSERVEPQVNGFITLMHEQAMETARMREAAIAKGGYLGPLDGVPVGVKDCVAVAGVKATAGAKANDDYVPAEDAEAVARLKAAGAVIVGKENMHEFAAGGRSNNPHYGFVRNPWDLERVPGGSSGGSGANVASAMTYASLGTDVGGSVRYPGHCCGVVGMKQTFGRASQRGSLFTWRHGDHVGPLTRTVADNALVLQAYAGHDPRDPSSVPMPVPDFSADLERGLRSVRVGVPRDWFFDVVADDVEEAVRRAVDAMREMGAEIVEVRLPYLDYARSVWLLMAVETAVTHERFLRERRADVTDDLVVGMLAGQFILARDYIKARNLERLVKEGFAEAMQQCDVIVSPTAPAVAPRIDAERITIKGQVHDLQLTRDEVLGRNTFLANITGMPAISVPCGFGEGGMPIGLQLTARPFEEPLLYRAAYAWEQASPARGALPPIAAA